MKLETNNTIVHGLAPQKDYSSGHNQNSRSQTKTH